MFIEREKSRLQSKIIETHDQTYFDCYANLIEAEQGTSIDPYVKAFGLCYMLGIPNLYDIGCACGYQAHLAHPYKVTYTGIDRRECACKRDRESWGKKYLFINEKYPYNIKVKEGNIAIIFCSLGAIMDDKERMETSAALCRDFERVVMSIYPDNLDLWKNDLKDFKLRLLGKFYTSGIPVLFGTKFEDDLEIINEDNYDWNDYKFAIDSLENKKELVARQNKIINEMGYEVCENCGWVGQPC